MLSQQSCFENETEPFSLLHQPGLPQPPQLPLVAPEPPLQTPGGLRNVVRKTQTWFKFPSCLVQVACNVSRDTNPSFLTPSLLTLLKGPSNPRSLMSPGSSQGIGVGGVGMLWAPVLPSMSRRCMMMASSTSLGMYPRERMAMPSSCLEMKPFPSRSRTRKASRISTAGKQRKANVTKRGCLQGPQPLGGTGLHNWT